MKKGVVGKKFRCQFGNDANLEMLSLIYSFKLYMCQDPRIARAYTAQYTKKKRACRLSRSASIRVHVDVRNGYRRVRGVGAAPRSNEAIWPRIPVPRIAYDSCRRHMRSKVAQKNGFKPIYVRLTCRPSTLKMRNISIAPNAIIYKDELERSTTDITRVLLDVSCSSCSLSNLLAWHSAQLLAIYVFYSFKPCRRQARSPQFG